jgi:hypothetical protein
MREHLLAGLALLLALPACGPADLPDGSAVTHAEPLIYGDDDREELHDLDSEALRDLLMQSVVALIPKAFLIADLKLTGVPTLGERTNLCSEEPFRLQPAAALCTGVLLDSDLILTAGHCVRALPLDQLAAVFGYAYSAPAELALSPAAIYDLSQIVAPCQAQPRPPPPGTGCSITRRSAGPDTSVFIVLFWLSVLRRRRPSSPGPA